jgi:hypothetical protein
MNFIKSHLTLVVAIFLSGCNTTSPRCNYSGIPATEIIVTISCSEPSLRFTGTIVSDGHSEQLSGTGSATFHAKGHEITCSFKKTDVDGRISIAVSEAGKKLGSASTPQRFGGVRAELIRTPSKQHTLFTNF